MVNSLQLWMTEETRMAYKSLEIRTIFAQFRGFGDLSQAVKSDLRTHNLSGATGE
jgi:hypothetical protein